MGHALKERVTSGAYASESEVVHDGLRALFAREQADRCCLTKLIRNVFQHERFSGRPHCRFEFSSNARLLLDVPPEASEANVEFESRRNYLESFVGIAQCVLSPLSAPTMIGT